MKFLSDMLLWMYRKFSIRQTPTTKHGLMGPSFNAGGGEHSCVYNGNAYYSAQLAAASGTVQAGSTPPTHTTGTVSDGQITWEYIGAVNTRLYLYGYTSLGNQTTIQTARFQHWC